MTLEPTKPVNKTRFYILAFTKLASVDSKLTEGKLAEYLLVTSLGKSKHP